MPRSLRLLVLALLGTASSAMAQADEPYGALVDRPGAEDTFIYCTACHSGMLVAQQGLSRERWDKLMVWMVEEQGMQEIPEPDRTTVLDYLSTHYGPDRPNFPRPK